MLLNPVVKDNISMISIHAELIMYGDVFINIEDNGTKGITVDWLSLCDGGDVADKGEKSYSSVSYKDLIDYFYNIDFPEQEDEEMNVSWEIQFFNQNEDAIDSNGFGYWNREVIMGIITQLQEIIKDEEPFIRQRMDVVLYGSRFTDASKYEGLVIELKAPSVPLSVSVLSQIERYANIVRTEPRFSGNNRIWKFIAVCSRIEDEVASRFEGYKLHGKPGLVSMIGNFEIYAFTWDDIFLSFQQRYSFIIQKIKDDMENLEPEIGPEEEISRELVTARVSALQNYSIAVNKNTEVSM